MPIQSVYQLADNHLDKLLTLDYDGQSSPNLSGPWFSFLLAS